MVQCWATRPNHEVRVRWAGPNNSSDTNSYFMVSIDGGSESTAYTIASTTYALAQTPIGYDVGEALDGSITITWSADMTGNGVIHLLQSRDGGTTWLLLS